MHRQQKYQAKFGQLYNRQISKAKQPVKAFGRGNSKRQHIEMNRQE
jgi:hypothetical protein